jgi:hypothetical protein
LDSAPSQVGRMALGSHLPGSGNCLLEQAMSTDSILTSLCPCGGETGAPPQTCLTGTLQLGPCRLRIRAIQVRRTDRGWYAVDPRHESDLGRIYDVSHTFRPATLRYLGRRYVVVMYPYEVRQEPSHADL